MARQPRRWRTSTWFRADLQEILGARPHERQADVYLSAPVKADARALLVRAGLRADEDPRRDDGLRVDESTPGQQLEAAGLISSYPLIMLRSVKDFPIVRLTDDGPVVVGHWRIHPPSRDRSAPHGLYVEAVEEARA